MNRIAIAAVALLVTATNASAFGTGCYGLPDLSGLLFCYSPTDNRCEQYQHDCQTVKALIDCGLQQRDAVAMVANRSTMNGYIGQIIAKCAMDRARK